ncbi:(3R)-hydroxymyristoyl-ACP dehydratase [Brachyspira hampsonii]|uniref:(3R)-hydroxymyristoyl-ACP dehydratase n=1 Tax=Brachyspira hampsonii 30446 TaxID=1289135 RepID=A0A2U4ETZ8_9SPIR|nr:(3R)-hydroxymyristoyl-ACP dehydratase [Brachyspira hampsonii]EKV56036.1 (3R)-hydroxymyristoyl-ACP dehydratase [Brachyspira hampsonii 30446]MBW5390318.1 3-hydroxyacyl-ACP dehydratase [Brachyspira hampsonii]MBW5394373.1 3-hydroxyacyl-ACP dehydratase [Brachyspira hampsonii]OEJ20055.1 3-hydroxyacyl-ACP dehydratase [Brachyspira hampsonii]
MKNKYKLNIPHKGKMLLIDGIADINFDDKEILSFSDIKKDNIFYDISEPEGIDSYIFTEYAAQTAAAYNGALSDNDDNKRIGFILNIKKADCYIQKIRSDNRVYIFVKETFNDKKIAYYDAETVLYNDDINTLDEYKKIVNDGNKIMDCFIMVMESLADAFKI